MPGSESVVFEEGGWNLLHAESLSRSGCLGNCAGGIVSEGVESGHPCLRRSKRRYTPKKKIVN